MPVARRSSSRNLRHRRSSRSDHGGGRPGNDARTWVDGGKHHIPRWAFGGFRGRNVTRPRGIFSTFSANPGRSDREPRKTCRMMDPTAAADGWQIGSDKEAKPMRNGFPTAVVAMTTAALLVPAAAEAHHVSNGSAECTLVGNVPTIKARASFTGFASYNKPIAGKMRGRRQDGRDDLRLHLLRLERHVAERRHHLDAGLAPHQRPVLVAAPGRHERQVQRRRDVPDPDAAPDPDADSDADARRRRRRRRPRRRPRRRRSRPSRRRRPAQSRATRRRRPAAWRASSAATGSRSRRRARSTGSSRST